MSKLRDAVSKARLKRLGQDIEPPTPTAAPAGANDTVERAERVDLRGRRRRRARAALGSHDPANENGGPSVAEGDSAQDESGEHEAIRAARERLRGMIEIATKDRPKPSIGVVLAIVNQETGNHAAANALIDEYGLTRLFGIKKFCPTS